MRARMGYALSLCSIATLAMACGATDLTPRGDDVTPQGTTKSLQMERTSDGQLRYCKDAKDCQSLPNPHGCATLQIDINTATGESCERCLDAAGNIITDGCGQTSVACTVVTIPDPDCVVCAYVNGAVIFSSCVAEQPVPPNCPIGMPSPTSCDGHYVSPGTDAQGCPLPVVCICPDGSLAKEGRCAPNDWPRFCFAAGECLTGEDCALPQNDCLEVVCSPNMDCAYRCLGVCRPQGHICPVGMPNPNTCDGEYVSPGYDGYGCPLPVVCICDDGSAADNGHCDPTVPPLVCVSDSECAAGELCTTSLGECILFNCGPNMNCIQQCTGTCQKQELVCPQLAAAPAYCEGTLTQPRGSNVGCPLPPVCICPDDTVAINGKCGESARVTAG
jgi:hypothetical protein